MISPVNSLTHPKRLSVLVEVLSVVFFLSVTSIAFANQNVVVRICDDIKAPPTLDPQKEFTEKNHTLLQQIYEGLVRFDQEGKIVPLLAVSWKQIDPLTMEFALRENVKFHNGEAFDASSVKFSIDRYLNPETGFPALGFISSIKEVEILNPLLIRIKTHYPDGLLLNRLAGFILIVPKRHVEKMGEGVLESQPAGTGPFRYKGWINLKDGIELTANPGYWRPGFPKTAGLQFRFIAPNDQVNALLNGEIDILTKLPGTQTYLVQKNGSTYVMKKPALFTTAASFNLCRLPTSNKAVRRALNMALNKNDLIRYDLLGNGRPIASFSMEGEFGRNENLRPYEYDPLLAEKILKEQGLGGGFTMNVLLETNARRTGQIIAKNFERIGVTLEFTLCTDADIMDYLKDRDRWDMVIGDAPDVLYHNYFVPAIFLYSESPFAICKNKAFDEKLDTMASTLDLKRQKELAEDLDQYVYDEALALFTYQRIQTYGMRKGFYFEPSANGMNYFDEAHYSASKQ